MANPTQEDGAWLSGQPSIATRLDRARVVRLGEKRVLRVAIKHAEGQRGGGFRHGEDREEASSIGGQIS